MQRVARPVREWAAAQPHADWAVARAHAAVVPLESADGPWPGSADTPPAVAVTRFAAAERVLPARLTRSLRIGNSSTRIRLGKSGDLPEAAGRAREPARRLCVGPLC